MHKTWYQYHAAIHGRYLSTQEARGWYSKIQKVQEELNKLQLGMNKALDRENVDLFLKLNDRWNDANETRNSLWAPIEQDRQITNEN